VSHVSRFSEGKRKIEELVGQGDNKITNTTVNVSNMDKEAYLEDFLDRMRKAGRVIGYYIPPEEKGKSILIHYDSNESAVEAVKTLNGIEIKRSIIKIE